MAAAHQWTRPRRTSIELRPGRWDAAIADCNCALEIEPKPWRSLCGRGIARLCKGEREAGERDLGAASMPNLPGPESLPDRPLRLH